MNNLLLNQIVPQKYQTTIEKIKTKIDKFDKIILLCHANPDGDALGCIFGLGHFLKSIYPNKKIMYDAIDRNNDNYLPFLERLPLANKKNYETSLLIILDTSNQERINSWDWKKGAFIIKIDHHTSYDDYGAINWVDDTRIAACELAALLVFSYEKPVPNNSAVALYTGIITDSNRFMYMKTDNLTFKIAEALTKTGIKITNIYENIYTQNWRNFKLKARIMSRMEITPMGVGKLVITRKQLYKMHNNFNRIKSFVNLFNYVKELKIWFIAIWNPKEKNIKISIRSQFYNIEKVAMKYGGGGHKLAAGCKISNFQQLPKIIKDLENLIKNDLREL